MNLKSLSHQPRRRLAGRLLLTALAMAGGIGALAARAEPVASARSGPIYEVVLGMATGGPAQSVKLRGASPADFKVVRTDDAGQRWELTLQVAPADKETVRIGTTIARDGSMVGTPALLLRLGEAGKVRVAGDSAASTVTLDLLVTEVATLVPPG